MRTILDKVSRGLAVLSMIILIVLMSLTTVSVIGRYFFDAPVPDDVVISQALLVVLVYLPFAFVQRQKAHLYVSLFTDWLPRRGRDLCDLFGIAVGIVFFAIVAAATYGDFHYSFVNGAYFEGPLQVPEWPSRLSVFVGTFVMCLQLMLDFVRVAGGDNRPETDIP